jgi:glycolate oxidase FAD binding subunit
MQPELTQIVGAGFVREAAAADSIDGVAPRCVVEPGTSSEVARVLAVANGKGWHVVPRGGGTKLGWGAPPRAAEVVLSLSRLNQVLEHAAGDMTATVEAGCTIATLQARLAERGQRLALDPLWPDRATVGGVLATADSGPLRWAYGPPRDLVLGVTVVLADGTVARSGGKVVKNVAGYDLPKLFTGSFGTLGVITQATFRLHPRPGAVRSLAFTLPSPETVGRFVAAMQECALLAAAVQIEADGTGTLRGSVLVEGLPEAIDAKAARVTDAAIAAGAALLPAGDWRVRESLFDGSPGVVCKVGLLPSSWVRLISALREGRFGNARWRLLAQSYGVGLLRYDVAAPEESGSRHAPVGILMAVDRLRTDMNASVVVVECPPAWKPQLDMWGDAGDALPLLRRVKEQFDPKGVLNPGRFVGEL